MQVDAGQMEALVVFEDAALEHDAPLTPIRERGEIEAFDDLGAASAARTVTVTVLDVPLENPLPEEEPE